MKVLLVSHRYPPRHNHGTELYTAGLARSLYRRRIPVVVFTTEKDIAAPNLSLLEKTVQDVPVVQLTNNLHFDSFEQSWQQPEIDRLFGDFLDRYRPTVVHFHHLLYLSTGLVREARRRSIPIVFTLHDYWLQCPRFGQRIHADGSICHDIDLERCAGCMTSFKYGQSPLEQRLSSWISGLKRRTGLDLAPLALAIGRGLSGKGRPPGSEAPAGAREEMLAALRRREQHFKSELVAGVDLFLSPSAFLRDELVRWGIPPERIRHLATGVDPKLFKRGERVPRAERLRVNFIGSRIPVKGAHLLLEAWAGLTAEQKQKAELRIIGPDEHEPAYQRRLRELAAEAPAELAPALAREEVGATLRATDLLVVPSLWFENAPLIILEALMVETPLLVAAIGGMAELVAPGRGGCHFEAGSVEDLRRQLARLIDAPEELERLCQEPPELPTQRAMHESILGSYRELTEAGGGGSPA